MSNRAPPRRPPPKQPRPFSPLVPGGNEKGGNAGLIQAVIDRHKQLMAHLLAKYPNSRRTQMMQVAMTTIRQLPEYVSRSGGGGGGSFISGTFMPSTGVLELAPRDPGGRLRPLRDLIQSYLHEAGHAIDSFVRLSDDHGPSWRKHTLWLADIATRELNWPFVVDCWDCDNYLLCQKELCPKCVQACNRRPGRRTIRGQSAGPFSTYPRSTYTRVCTQKNRAWPWLNKLCSEYDGGRGSRQTRGGRGPAQSGEDTGRRPSPAPAPPAPVDHPIFSDDVPEEPASAWGSLGAPLSDVGPTI